MDLVNESEVPAPALPFEDIECAPLGGMVRVQSLDLLQRLTIEARAQALRSKNVDLGDAAAYPLIPEVLAMCVVGRKGTPIHTAHRWKLFGAQHQALALQMFNAAWRLSGMSGDDAKKN
jgi:hypothetical protein